MTLFNHKQKHKQLTAFAVGSVLCSAAFAAAQTTDAENQGSYYEDDAWYDITEWFDGNDYNPTDEAWWRWDNETYEASKDSSGDSDTDVYGFYDDDDQKHNADDDWYYDYYDDNYSSQYDYDTNNNYEFQYSYLDVDNDGLVDAYYSFYDSNGDGTFDEMNYIAFNTYGESAQGRHSTADMKNRDSKPETVTGEITNSKQVSVRDTKHQVVQVKTSDGKTMTVDLGDQRDLSKFNLAKGDRISAKGFVSKVGDKNVVLARSLTVNGQTLDINRSGREITGEVTDTHTATLRGTQHTFAMIKKSDGKKCVVDLGPTDKLPTTVKKGQKVTVTGVPVKVNETAMLLATQMERDGKMHDINRRVNWNANKNMNDSKQNTRGTTNTTPGKSGS